MSQGLLFDLVADVPAGDVDDSWVELREDDSAAASCRFCQTASTAAGIVRHEHGPESRTCERMRALIAELEAAGVAS